MTKYCKCGHRKDRHQRAGRNWPIRCLDCNYKDSYHQYQEAAQSKTSKKGDKE
jgi:hypothetical protein